MVAANQNAALLTAADVGKLVGLTPRRVQILANAGQIPFVRLSSKTLRFEAASVQQWIESRRVNGTPRHERKTTGTGAKYFDLPSQRTGA